MAQQIPLDPAALVARAEAGATERGVHDVLDDLGYRRLAIVNVIFVGRPGAGDRQWVLIDAGIPGTSKLIKRAASARFGDRARPSSIVMTHGHFDHVGALETLAEEWDAPVYAHALEHAYLNGSARYPAGDPTVGGGTMALLSSFYPTKPVDVGSRLRALPADGSIPVMPGWRWLHTPGHSPGHVSFWRETDRALIVGDAFTTVAAESAYATTVQTAEIHGPPKYFTIDWDAARASVQTLAKLKPQIVISGHGRPLQGELLQQGLDALARDFDRVAIPQHGLYVDKPAKAGDAYLKV